MRGSLALWYESLSGSPKQDLPLELHFNLWRDLSSGSNFFDIGILLKPPTRTSPAVSSNAEVPQSVGRITDELRRIFLFIPAEFNSSHISDLCPVMEHGRTLNAVFNDVITITKWNDLSFETEINSSPHLTFHKITIQDDMEFTFIEMEHDRIGTLITFRDFLCQRFSSTGNHYLRLRFQLDRRTRDLFSSETRPSDWFLVSSFNRTELTEFRLNERRSLPDAVSARLTDRSSRPFHIERVHYFLMRDSLFELIGAHTNFRKMRRLEEDLWRHYLRGIPPGGRLSARVERAVRTAADRLIIYQWRLDKKDNIPIEDFIAFANFRLPIPNLYIYAIVIVFLGGAGAALHAIILNGLQDILPWRVNNLPPSNLAANSLALLVLTVAALLPVILTLTLRSFRRIWEWGNRKLEIDPDRRD